MNRLGDTALDVQIGLELNRALVSRNGDAAVTSLADFIRAHHIQVSMQAWEFLEFAVRSQWLRAGAD